MRKTLILLLALISASAVYSQTQQKVAVYVTGGEEDGINGFIGAYLVDAIVKSSNYLAVERTADFLRELKTEQAYQRTGNVQDDQISELGKQFGVQLVCVAQVGKVGDSQFVSARLIDVETVTVKSSTKPVLFTIANIDKSCATVALSLINGEPIDEKDQTVVEKKPAKQLSETVEPAKQLSETVEPVKKSPVTPKKVLVAKGINVYLNAKYLTQNNVRHEMSINDEALQLYNKGIRKNKSGKILLGSGIGLSVAGLGMLIAGTILSADGITISSSGFGGMIYEENYYFEGVNLSIAGGAVLGCGLVMTGGGIVLKIIGKKQVKKAVDLYNTGSISQNYKPEIYLGAALNGVKLTVNF
jgi:hypothetical protein